MSDRRARDLASLALLTLAVAAFFWPLILTQSWIPRGGGDLVSFLWPMYRFSARSLRSGTVPLWNPHLYSGAPFVADNQSGVFYPINLITYALVGPPSYRVMEGLVVFHVWLAAVGAFVLLRDLRLRRSAAVLGALAFALSDLFITHVGNLNLNATAAWLPLTIWATHRALERRSVGWAAAAGLTVSVAALAGHAQMLLFLVLTLGLYTLYRLAALIIAGGGNMGRQMGQTIGLTLLIGIVGLGGAALMLLPAWQMAAHTGRGHLPYQEATRYSLPPRALIGLLAPGFYGRGAANFWGPWERVEVGYAGVVTLTLALLGIGSLAARLVRRSGTRAAHDEGGAEPIDRVPFAFFSLLIPLAFLLAMGRYTPLYRLLYRFVPTFDQIRAPARLIVLADLGMAVMAAYGLDQLRSRATGRWPHAVWPGLITAAAALLLLALGLPQARSVPPPDRVLQATQSIVIAAALLMLSGTVIALARWRSWAQWLVPVLLAVDLIALGSTLEIDRHDPTVGFHHPDVVAFLQEDEGLFRIEDHASAWQPDAALVHGLYDIGGIYNPLSLAPYQAYRWAVGQRGSPLYNLLGVKYVLADKGKPPGDERLVPVYAGAEIDIYLNTAALPRALFVTDPHVVSDHEAAWQAIHASSFDPARTVVLEQEGTRPSPRRSDGPPTSRIAFLRYGLNAVELRVESPTSGWLVLSDVYYPGWRASVDGEATPVLRADYTFRAVSVPAGEHTVRMTFAPQTWYLGLACSLATWLALTAAGLLKLRKA
jgi:hypothetical protein